MKQFKFFITTTLFTLQSVTQAVGVLGAAGGGSSIAPIQENLLMLSEVNTGAADAGSYLLQQVAENEDTFQEIRMSRILGSGDPFVGIENSIINIDCSGSRKTITPTSGQIEQVSKMEISMSRYGNACRDTLYNIDLQQGAKEKIDFKQYCNCINNVSMTVEQKSPNINSTYGAFKNKFHSAIVANRLYNLFDLIKDNAGRLEKYRKYLTIKDKNLDRFTCSKSDIDKISQRIQSCLGPEVSEAIDSKFGFDFETLVSMDNESKARQRLEDIFDKSNLEIAGYFDDKIASENLSLAKKKRSKKNKFIDLFIIDFNEQRISGNGYSREYMNNLKTYIYNHENFSREFYSFREKEIKNTDKLSRSLYYQTNGKDGRLDYADQVFTAEEENQFLIQYVSLFGSKFMKTMVRDANDFEQVSKALKEIKNNNIETKNFIYDSLRKHIKELKEEVITECDNRIRELEYTCDPSKLDDVMKNISAVEFTEANEIFGGNDIEVAEYYCSSIDNGEISQAVAGGYGSFGTSDDPASVFDEVRGRHGQQIASLRESYEKSGVANTFNSGKRHTSFEHNSQEGLDNNAFAQTAEYLNKKYSDNSRSSSVEAQSTITTIPEAQVNNSTSQSVSNVVSTKDERVDRNIENQVDKIENQLASNTNDDTEAQELRKQLRALKEQLANVAKNALAVNEESTKKRERHPASEQPINENSTNNGMNASSYAGPSNFQSQARAVASTGTVGSRGISSMSTGSSSGAAAIVSSLGPAEMTSGLSLSSSTRSDVLSVSDNRIGKQDRKLVADAISQGSTRVILADGQTYFIGHDDNGNVILSQSKDALYEVAIVPELEGPQLEIDQIKNLNNAGRSIASEPSEVSSEDSIYSQFLDAAEISE
ncbi:hypothetical protein M902_2697 [Bacteriovorax sp. BAL6_X]|uniref:hypothetical protein n=1 Tax=Bacteriovorax sp. BAL6_X TaxID=1201290 RepID=UPI0003863D9D|nr:hypothetical protein [Bacteriovorax sp. BAL6_X]EPZ51096.1 hypothetical protein M902_2697 [Bacteriovorax sp. BAL6_X]